jgi:hypothetical protein
MFAVLLSATHCAALPLQGPALLTEPCPGAPAGRYVFDASSSADASMRPLSNVVWEVTTDPGAHDPVLVTIVDQTNNKTTNK